MARQAKKCVVSGLGDVAWSMEGQMAQSRSRGVIETERGAARLIGKVVDFEDSFHGQGSRFKTIKSKQLGVNKTLCSAVEVRFRPAHRHRHRHRFIATSSPCLHCIALRCVALHELPWTRA